MHGSPARDCGTGASQSFAVDPNFLSYTAEPITITAVLSRKGAGNAGFNLAYESATGWKGTGAWYTIPGDTQWITKTWTITDPQFVARWGIHFSFNSDSTTYSQYYLQCVTVSKAADVRVDQAALSRLRKRLSPQVPAARVTKMSRLVGSGMGTGSGVGTG